jgi:hypothetical protein
VEAHSHHAMPAFFSIADNRDEARSFRLFAVIGRIFKKCEIRLRVGVFGYFWDIDPGLVFDMPQELQKSPEAEAAKIEGSLFEEDDNGYNKT